MTYGIPKNAQIYKKKKPKKATNKSTNPYFKFLRDYRHECIICGDYSEIHHIDLGYSRNDDRVVMLCNRHHSAQSMLGIHHDFEKWYNLHYTFEELEEIAEENLRSYNEFER